MAAHGITPAWAGKRQTAAMPRTMTRVHPRMGREKTMYFEDKYFCRGSPPRGRGKEPLSFTSAACPGITPAWAGKSWQSGNRLCFTWDHPRMGGEKLTSGVFSSAEDGSPPHGRGKERRVVDHHPLPGITPAWAGKSPEFRLPYLQSEDHPRVGGEKYIIWSRSCIR